MVDELLEELSEEVCLDLLRAYDVGRIAVVVEGDPVVVPINYLAVDRDGEPAIVLRTRRGNVIDSGSTRAALQIDGIDPVHQCGWSVLARGVLRHLDDDAIAALEEHPRARSWLGATRDTWLVIEHLRISGRRLRAPEAQWAFHIRGYL
jgi:nitroimidazol reductase NimA-like FMN-containing flavoprotein (pyridoxamine 5'-phosphate oxidase superfamily)